MTSRAVAALALVLGLVVVVGAVAWLSLTRGPAGPAVAESNPCDAFPALNGALTEWMQQWRRLQPALTCEHFEESGRTLLAVGAEQAWEDAAAEAARAPGRRLDPGGRRLLAPSGPELAVVDLTSGTRRVLLAGGPGTAWRDAGWMDDRALVAAGEAPGPVAGVVVPTLAIVRLDANSATTYRGPSVTRAELDALRRPPAGGAERP